MSKEPDWNELTSRHKDSVAYWKGEGFVLVHRDDVKECLKFLPKYEWSLDLRERFYNILEE